MDHQLGGLEHIAKKIIHLHHLIISQHGPQLDEQVLPGKVNWSYDSIAVAQL